MQKQNNNENDKNHYIELLSRHGLTVEQMAEHLARQTRGSVQEWLQAIQTGDKSAISTQTASNTKTYYDANEAMFQRRLGQLMMQ